jgi:hypothetical protein
MASALPVGNFGTFPFRGQLSGKPLPASTFLVVVPKSEHKGAWKTQFALEVSVVVISPESADQAIAKVLPFPAPTDCKSADECVPGDNCLKEVRATLEVDRIERKSK